MEATKKGYPNVDYYLLWSCSVDYVLEEKGLKKDNEDGVKMYEEYIKQRKIFIYNSVKVVEDDVINMIIMFYKKYKKYLIVIISHY
jgi:hypothetical protein